MYVCLYVCMYIGILNPKFATKPQGKVIGVQCGLSHYEAQEFQNAISNFAGEVVRIDNIDDKNDENIRKIRAKLCESVGTGQYHWNLSLWISFLGEFDLAQSEAIEIDVIVEKDEKNSDQPNFVKNYLKKYKSESEAEDPTKNIVFKLYNPKSETFENLPTSDHQMVKKIERIDF